MLNLDYIIVGALPLLERMYLEENLKRDGLMSVCSCAFGEPNGQVTLFVSGTGEGQKMSCRTQNAAEPSRLPAGSGIPADGFCPGSEPSRLPAERGILVSGDAGELLTAKRRGMAALGYSGKAADRVSALCGAAADPGRHDGQKETVCSERNTRQASLRMSSEPTDGLCADMYAEGLEEVDLRFLTRIWQRHHHLPWTILTTRRCVVKEFSMDDLDDLFALYAGEGMTDYIAPLYPYEQEMEYQRSYIECMYGFYGYGMWIVRDRADGSLIGRAGIECREELGGEPELGYVIGVPYQRKGYATEVCTAILAYAGEELSLPFINCLIEEGNIVSEHVALRLGFAPAGELFLDGKRMKKYRYRLF